MRIAIMQPYFVPYAGYFRLFVNTDLFVILDCVQFIRRGFIHRNRLSNANGELQWLTLPLKKAPQTIAIKELEFPLNIESEWKSRLNVFPRLSPAKIIENSDIELMQLIRELSETPLDYIISILKKLCHLLNLPFNVIYSSTLNLPQELKGQEKIIAITKRVCANEYVNLSGGRSLYQADIFKHHGIKLNFLSQYQGSYASILECLLTTELTQLRHDIINQSKFEG